MHTYTQTCSQNLFGSWLLQDGSLKEIYKVATGCRVTVEGSLREADCCFTALGFNAVGLWYLLFVCYLCFKLECSLGRKLLYEALKRTASRIWEQLCEMSTDEGLDRR